MTAESHLDDLVSAYGNAMHTWGEDGDEDASLSDDAAKARKDLTDAIVALRTRAEEQDREIERLKVDAERYRWLRHDYVSPRRSRFAVVVNNAHPSGLKRYWDISLDAALDAEMRAEQIEKDKGG